MRIKRLEANSFKRFTHLIVEGIPETTKLIVLVGPNGSGKTSFFEAINYYYKYWSFGNMSDVYYIEKMGKNKYESVLRNWGLYASDKVKIDFYDMDNPNVIGDNAIKTHFYFRSAYRNEPELNINYLSKIPSPLDTVRLDSFIQNDMTVSQNYQHVVADSLSGLYNKNNNGKSVLALREELIGILEESLGRIFDDLTFEGIGNPIEDASFYFSKGDIENFNYKNLSAGEKAAFDLLLDMVVQSRYYEDAIFCIDEPEIHMHTKLQGRVLNELYNLITDNSQLIVSTHSIGMLNEAEQIEKENPNTVVFLDFSERDFDTDQIIRPSKISRAVQEKFYELAFGDFSKLLLPKQIVFCEGSISGKKRKDFDKRIYTLIFEKTKPDTLFLSVGSCNDIEKIEEMYGVVLDTILKESNIIKLVDRDDRSDDEIEDFRIKGIRTLSRRNIESYLLDDELIKKLCVENDKQDLVEDCIREKNRLIDNNRDTGKPYDDYKKIRGEYYVFLKSKLNLTRCGNDSDSFLRDTMARLITEDTEVYKTLEADIFG